MPSKNGLEMQDQWPDEMPKKLLKSERLNTFNLLNHLRTLHFHDRGRILPKNLHLKKYITLCRFVS